MGVWRTPAWACAPDGAPSEAPVQRRTHAVVIHNYSALQERSPAASISINIGELVEILLESDNWYFGRRVGRCLQEKGIFPKGYVKLRECNVDRTGSVEVVSIVQPQIVQEITHTLREWGQHWKLLFVANEEQFKIIEHNMRALLQLRSSILSGTLPLDQLKKTQRAAMYTIDKGNRELNMDLTVRCAATGWQIDPSKVSTCQLCNLHVETTESIKKREETTTQNLTNRLQSCTSFSFFASVRNFVCKMSEDAELLMCLYDGTLQKPFTENYVVHWSRDGLTRDIDQLHNLKVLFTDLGSHDIKREKVFLVCYVVRIGGMEPQTNDNRRSSMATLTNNRSNSHSGSILSNGDLHTKASHNMRRPLGVVAMDVTHVLSGQLDVDDDKQYCIPFFPCEKDNLESLLKKIINKDLKTETKTGQGLWISVKLLPGDFKQIREELPHLLVGNVSISRKMGFPEVILPSDARNDLYLCLSNGYFTKGGSKSYDRNIQVTIKVCNKHGETIPGVISLGGGVQPMDEYNSVIYYHEDRPKWNETFKICVPIEEFKSAHILFLYKHRSSNEAKDKAEKPFALSFTPLMQSNGTTLNDMIHYLKVYKVDSKKWPNNDIEAASCYLKLPSQRSGINEKENSKIQKGFLSLTPKDFLAIETNVCSTKLTQNVELLGVLNWSDHVEDGSLAQALKSLQDVPGGEIVKFLQDILDALFTILTHPNLERSFNSTNPYDSYDYLVFECLLCLISLVSDRKYHHFQPVLDLYIKDSFCAPLAYKKLCQVLIHLILDKPEQEKNEVLLKSMKCLEYMIRFIVKSRELHAELTQKTDQLEFQSLFQTLLDSITTMMRCNSDYALTSQGFCIKYLPAIVPHVMQVFPDTQLSMMIGKILDDLPLSRITKQRLMAVLDLVQGPLFANSKCRCILLPHITHSLKILIQSNEEIYKHGIEIRSKNRSVDKVARVLGASRHKLREHKGYSEQLELCIKVLAEILTLLFSCDMKSTEEEFNHITSELLKTVIFATSQMDRENPLVCQLVSILLEMFRQMSLKRYNTYVSKFPTPRDLLNFLIEVQVVLRDLVEKPVFSNHWADMINLQNHIVLKTLKLFSVTLVDVFLSPLKQQVWSNWFHLAIAFLTQPRLQLEKLTPDQRRRLTLHYGDLRTVTASEITRMWYELDQSKIDFIPELISPFLEMSLVPEIELRKTTIPLFFDMMQCEYNSPKFSSDCFFETNPESVIIKRKFERFEDEMIHKLDVLVEGGKGDSQWCSLFIDISNDQWVDQPELKKMGDEFVLVIERLLKTLLQYRSVQDNSSVDHRMQAITTLLEFYSTIKRPEMYIRYVNKLCELNLECENWTEAGLTLRLHAKLLQWSNTPLNALLKSLRHPDCQTHRDLKEALYYDIIQYLDKGKMWELAIGICKELVKQYEDEVFDYINLSELYKKMSLLYDAIMKQLRLQPEYFRVGYYGNGFPEFLRNKEFVYRGKEFEKLQDFCSRTMNVLPNAELMNKLTSPSDDILNSPLQYVQINAVEPIMSDDVRISGHHVSDQILKYYKFNDVSKFRFSRKFTRRDEQLSSIEDAAQNEFASLWLERTELKISDKLPGILRWLPVSKKTTYEMSPLQVAVDTMKETNKNLRHMILQHKADDSLHAEPLTRTLSGIVDAAVMGGTANYEKAFFTEEYQNAHPENKALIAALKDQIAMQIPLLEYGIEIHRTRIHLTMMPLHKRISECFDKMKTHVHENYGVKNCDLDKEISLVTMRRQINNLSNNCIYSNTADDRWSEISTQTNSSESGISVGRSHAMSLKTSFSSPFNKQANRGSLGTSMGSGYTNLGLSPANFRSQVSMLTSSPARKRDKDKRRTRKQSDPNLSSIQMANLSTGSSQWYTGALLPGNPVGNTRLNSIVSDPVSPSAIFELRQELTPSRPLRSEIEREKRISQRQSIQSETNSNRNSAGTTDSNLSAEDDPPPLPQKTVRIEIVPPPLPPPITETYYQAINYSVNTPVFPESVSRSAVTSPVFTRQDYDTVLKPRRSYLYSSLPPDNIAAVKKGLNIIKKERAPTPPPKKRMNSVQH